MISGYTTFLRILSDGRCCGFWVRVGLVRIGGFVFGQEMGHARSGLGEGLVRDGTGRTRPERGVFSGTWTTRPASPPCPGPVGIRRSHNSPEKRIAQSPVPAGRRLCSGFRVVGGLSFRINDARTLMGLVLVWPFVALGMTCFAARTTSFTGAPMVMNAIVWSRVWAAARSEYGEAWGEIGS